MKNSFEQIPTAVEKPINPEKMRLWDEKRKEIDGIGDLLGKGIDENMKEAVTAFNMHGLPTSNSCEGHLDHGVPFSFAKIEAPNKPKWKYEGEKELFESVAKEKNIPLEKTERQSPAWDVDAYEEVFYETGNRMNKMANEGKDLTDTEEYKKWKEENKKLYTEGQELLSEFYGTNMPENEDVKIAMEGVEENGFDMRNQTGFNHFVDALNWRQEINEKKKRGEEMPPEEIEKLSAQLKARQTEMSRFAEFLKQKFTTSE